MTTPNLIIWPDTGLTFPWAWWTPPPAGSISDASFGPDGVAACETMLIYWEDFESGSPLQQILGFSWRDGSTNPPTLRRVTPMQHPFYEQIYCTKIVKVELIKPSGEVIASTNGPIPPYTLVRMTLQFTRPPYSILEDSEIISPFTGLPQEWLRYTTSVWSESLDFLAREGTFFKFSTAGTPNGKQFPGSIGLPACRSRLTMTWYQLPQLGVYNANGFPQNMNYDYTDGTTRLPGTVNAAEDGPTDFLGIAEECLLYLVPDIQPHPLQLPAALMNLGTFAEANPANLQFNAVITFLFFDPPAGPSETKRGHNLAPWADNFWYYVVTQQAPNNPPFASTQFSKIFQIN